MKNFIKYIDDHTSLIIFGLFVILLLAIVLSFAHDTIIDNEIIKKSEDYITFKDCRRIDSLYYCIDLVED